MTLYISGKGGIDDSICQPSGSAYKELYAKQQNQNDKLNKENKHKNNEFDEDEEHFVLNLLSSSFRPSNIISFIILIE